MSSSDSSFPYGPVPEDTSDDDGSPVPPMYLIGEGEADDILHPVYATAYRVDAPPGTPGFESILFRQEDYTEPGDENWEYAGLIPLVPGTVEYDEDISPEELEAARAEEIDEWDYPPSFPCPRCKSGEAQALPETLTADFCLYTCGRCERLMILETRAHIRNAAVLFVGHEDPKKADPPVTD